MKMVRISKTDTVTVYRFIEVNEDDGNLDDNYIEEEWMPLKAMQTWTLPILDKSSPLELIITVKMRILIGKIERRIKDDSKRRTVDVVYESADG